MMPVMTSPKNGFRPLHDSAVLMLMLGEWSLAIGAIRAHEAMGTKRTYFAGDGGCINEIILVQIRIGMTCRRLRQRGAGLKAVGKTVARTDAGGPST